MKPIQERAETALSQALRCVQFRTPNRHGLKPRAYTCALGLRYGLIGAAAAYFTLEIADPHEERELKNVFRYWPLMVAEHYKTEIEGHTDTRLDEMAPANIARLSGSPLKVSLALSQQLLPLQRVLEIAAEVFLRDHRSEITSETIFFRRHRATEVFRQVSEQSIHYAMHFFERRRAGLDEVSEIALLGE